LKKLNLFAFIFISVSREPKGNVSFFEDARTKVSSMSNTIVFGFVDTLEKRS